MNESGTRTRIALDPHVHSEGSYDASVPVRRLLEAASARGLDGIVVCDHDVIRESLRAVELAPEFGLIAIPGIEVSTQGGHLLAIGVESAPPSDLPFDLTVSKVQDEGGVAVVPHPFQRSRHGARRRVIAGAQCDGIETLNACSLLAVRNDQARQFASKRGIPQCGGSDAHRASEVGRAYTEIRLEEPIDDPGEIDPNAVLEAMRCGATCPRGSRSRRHRALSKYARNVRVKSGGFLRAPAGTVRFAGSLLGREDR